MAERGWIGIEVVYALPGGQIVVNLEVPVGTTVRQALDLSAIAEKLPDVDLGAAPLGIFGERVSGEKVLLEHDRVEIYRPLMVDPKQARRARARARR